MKPLENDQCPHCGSNSLALHSRGAIECCQCRQITYEPYLSETTVFEEWVASLQEFNPVLVNLEPRKFYSLSTMEVES